MIDIYIDSDDDPLEELTIPKMLNNIQVSVLQPWVSRIPLRAQGTLLTAVRGCDLTPKFPLDSVERVLVGMVRCAFLVPADPREVDKEPGCFFITPDLKHTKFKESTLGHYPLHWYTHVMHACEVIAYCHPDIETMSIFLILYEKLVTGLHLNKETVTQFMDRMLEDRVVKGNIVG